jgi:hypothetical protein
MNAGEIRARLYELHLEQLDAESAGLGDCAGYTEDLVGEISRCNAAYVGAAVTELAVRSA